jgi:SAM-dependent methyltransferase
LRHLLVKQQVKTAMARMGSKVMGRLADDVSRRLSNSGLADEITYRITLETMLQHSVDGKTPFDVFNGVSDPFWFWLQTEGYRRSAVVRSLLPAMPDEDVQVQFTGNSGDSTLREVFSTYIVFRDLYETHVGPIEECPAVLDFGCGWGRIIRFFLKDIEASRLWGVDPLEQMIAICKRDVFRCNFEVIETTPPSRFPDDTFGLVYAHSVFSHLSEERHQTCLADLARILKPGGLLLVTTRPREFIQECAAMRKRSDLHEMHPGPRRSASAFVDTERSLLEYDRGDYCFSQLIFDGEWSYWGATAIPKAYVMRNWSERLTFLDYIDDRKKCAQNVIVMRKPD